MRPQLWLLWLSLPHLISGKAQGPELATQLRLVTQQHHRICPLPSTAAVRLHDGSLHHIALIHADVDYLDLMQQLATRPRSRTPVSLDGVSAKMCYLFSRALRLAKKLTGWPATAETAVLARMVSMLLKATQSWLGDGAATTAAVLSSPDHIWLTDEEIGDVFDYLKLKNLAGSEYSLYQLYATSATYAGYGEGLCRNYIDAYVCEQEESELPDQRVLHLDLSMGSFSGTLKSLRSAHDGSVDASFVDLDLGFRHASADASSETPYWTALSYRIRELIKHLETRVYMPHVTELLLTGPQASDRRFKAAIRSVLHDSVAFESLLDRFKESSEVPGDGGDWQSLFTFATARGAAEIAKRKQEGPVKCAQTDECRRRRSGAGEL